LVCKEPSNASAALVEGPTELREGPPLFIGRSIEELSKRVGDLP
jgi:hypothetical protein